MNFDVFSLVKMSKRFGSEVESISKTVLDNPDFSTWWGGLKGQHHDFTGGLARHTREVVELCFNSVETLGLDKIDDRELFLSVLFHDSGKMFDYKVSPMGDMIASEHKRIIHHISRSALIWSHAVVKHDVFSKKYHDIVLHNILSHHGSREWGSPVSPKTKVAWLLHLCDGISARMDDCDRLDLVVNEKKSTR